MAVDTPKLRQVGTGSDRRFQWQFADGKWRDMVPGGGLYAAIGGRADNITFDHLVSEANYGKDMLPENMRDNATAAYMEVLKLLWSDVTGLNTEGLTYSKNQKDGPGRGYQNVVDGNIEDPVTWNWDGRERTWQREMDLLTAENGDLRLIGPRWNESAPM